MGVDSAPCVSVQCALSSGDHLCLSSGDHLCLFSWAQESCLEYPSPNQYALGKPSPYSFRDEIPLLDARTLVNGKPNFVTAVGSYWPRHEQRPPAVVTMTAPGEPSLRLGATENLHHGNTRLGWAPPGPLGAFA